MTESADQDQPLPIESPNSAETPPLDAAPDAMDDSSTAENRLSLEIKTLDPTTIWLPACEAAVGAIVPGFFVGFFVGHFTVVWFVTGFVVVPSIVANTIKFLTYKYWLTPSEIEIRSGLFFRRERRIPFDRVQNVELGQGLVARLLNCAKVRISTAGSEDLKAQLYVLNLDEAAWLKQAIATSQQRLERGQNDDPSEGTSIEQPVESPPTVLCRLATRDLIRGGLTSNVVATLGLLIGAVVYFYVVASLGIPWLEKLDAELERNVPYWSLAPVVDWVETYIPRDTKVGAVLHFLLTDSFAKAVLAILGGLITSVGRFIIRYHGFELMRRHDILDKSHGLFSHRRISIPCERIQALKIEETLLRRWLRLASIRVDSGGDRSEVNENKDRDYLVPITTLESARQIAFQSVAGLRELELNWRQISPKAVMRGTRIGWLTLLPAVIAMTYFRGWQVILLAPVFAAVYYINLQWFRNTAYSLDADFFVSRRGWVNRSTLYLPLPNIQNVTVSRSFFDRRLGLATLSVDTAGQSNTGGGPVILNLEVEQARRLQRKLIARVV